MAFSLFGGGSQTVKTAPWRAQQPFLKAGFAQAQDLLNRPTFNDTQQQGFDLATDFAGSMGPLIGGAQNALNFAMNPNILSPESNPFLAQQAQAAARPLTQNLTENILPAIRSGAGMAGQVGGSRQGIAEGIAARGTQQAIADQSANIFSGAYGQGLNAMMQGLSQAPNVANLGLMPANILQQVGTTQQQMPWQNLQQFMQAVGGNFGGTQTTPTGSPLGALAGAAIGGLGIPGLFKGGGLPGAKLGIGLGGLLS